MKKDFFLNLVSCLLLFFIFFNLIFIFVLKRNYGNVRLNLYFELVAFVLLIIIDNYKIIKQKNLNFDLQETNKRLECCYDNVRSFKHDFSNIMQSIGGYIAVKDIEGLKKMYSSIVGECQAISNIKGINRNQINNPAIYHLINKKYAMARELGIKMSVMVFFDLSQLNVSDFEICRILGILLDNAIEATEECDEKFISIKFIYDKFNLRDLIIIENPCKNYLINDDQLFSKGFTTKKKKAGHGLGLWKVNQIIKMNKNIEIATERSNKFKQAVSIKIAG